MKKAALFVCLLMLLASCSKSPSADELSRRLCSSFSETETLCITASVRADSGERVYDFLLKYTRDGSGAFVTILEPECVSGIAARISGDGVALEYAGAEIYIGQLTASGLSPAAAIPLAVSAWESGLLTSARLEGSFLITEHYISEGVSLVSRFDSATLIPSEAELFSDGFRTVDVLFDDVVM